MQGDAAEAGGVAVSLALDVRCHRGLSAPAAPQAQNAHADCKPGCLHRMSIDAGVCTSCDRPLVCRCFDVLSGGQLIWAVGMRIRAASRGRP